MAKPKAEAWLTEAFRDGVIELMPERPIPAYKGALGRCWLAQHDPLQRPCSGPFERFHFIPRQRVENSLWALLPPDGCRFALDPLREAWEVPHSETWEFGGRDDLILLAAWDPRNGGIGCEHHHRRYDGHACSPQAPKIVVPLSRIPGHLTRFALDWGLEHEIDRRFPDQ